MKPQMLISHLIHSMFQDTSTQYNDPSVSYSSSTQTYGGSDRNGGYKAPHNASMSLSKPNSIEVN